MELIKAASPVLSALNPDDEMPIKLSSDMIDKLRDYLTQPLWKLADYSVPYSYRLKERDCFFTIEFIKVLDFLMIEHPVYPSFNLIWPALIKVADRIERGLYFRPPPYYSREPCLEYDWPREHHIITKSNLVKIAKYLERPFYSFKPDFFTPDLCKMIYDLQLNTHKFNAHWMYIQYDYAITDFGNRDTKLLLDPRILKLRRKCTYASTYDANGCDFACLCGYVDVITKIHDECDNINHVIEPEHSIKCAIVGNQLPLLKLLLNYIDDGFDNAKEERYCWSYRMLIAIKHNKLEILKWLFSEKPFIYPKYLLTKVQERYQHFETFGINSPNPYLEMLEWIKTIELSDD